MPTAGTYWHRFGSLRRAYALIGYEPNPIALRRADHLVSTNLAIEAVAAEIRNLFPDKVATFRAPWKKKTVFLLDTGVPIAIASCRRYWTRKGQPRWLLRSVSTERRYVNLLCLLNQENDAFETFYLLPGLDDSIRNFRWLKSNDAAFDRGIKLEKLSDFYEAVRKLAQNMGTARQVMRAG